MKWLLWLAGLLITAVAGHFAFTMATKTVPYFSFQRGVAFLGTKPGEVLDTGWYMAAFYVHITSSLIVICAGIIQMWPWVVRQYRRIHRLSGYIYVCGVLLLAAPSGLLIAVYANAGLASRVAFTLQSIVWWLITAAAWQAIRKHQWRLHTEWMIRSFAVTLAAMSLRGESFLMFYYFHTKPIETYVTVSWLSWVGNLIIAELLIWFGLGRKMTAASGRLF